ncbi:hypothetical protein AXG93_2752s1610 [Marchantia polymorpha subsp. ruderalis]|uniref:Uncharacterized protein n=1 Tax=Marchantia polymorpha subsp. ruderalis TaxID=1480154 RepID=A0A176VW95_MARPO|nr:hypothetical protein AXG93_2752s1610 [Marchantia polymorpha subsp. ruderalis]
MSHKIVLIISRPTTSLLGPEAGGFRLRIHEVGIIVLDTASNPSAAQAVASYFNLRNMGLREMGFSECRNSQHLARAVNNARMIDKGGRMVISPLAMAQSAPYARPSHRSRQLMLWPLGSASKKRMELVPTIPTLGPRCARLLTRQWFETNILRSGREGRKLNLPLAGA